MKTGVLNNLILQVEDIHKKAENIIGEGGFSPILKNEYKNKISQYVKMYESVETMKKMTDNAMTLERLIDQQIEILNVRIVWEKDWIKKTGKGEL
ncbi:MAG: hypothetical protein K6E13_06820 [Lachnospiraceae bacterium]|nr:hypothetical protein [Lachnospiraceae bacterium]